MPQQVNTWLYLARMNSEGKQMGIMVLRPYEAHWYVGRDRAAPEPNVEPPLSATLCERFWDFVHSIGVPQVKKPCKRQPIDD
jgi:hypothetical protein